MAVYGTVAYGVNGCSETWCSSGVLDPNVAISNITQSLSPVQTTFTATVSPNASYAEDFYTFQCFPESNCPNFSEITGLITLCPVNPPSISSVSPNTWPAGQQTTVTISGANFVTSAAAAATPGCPSTLVNISTSATLSYAATVNSESSITVVVEPEASAPEATANMTPRPRGPAARPAVSDPVSTADITVSTTIVGPDDGAGPVPAPATATAQIVPAPCPVPTVSSVSPNVWFAGQTSKSVTITGTNFITNAAATTACPATTVSVSAPSGAAIALGSVTVSSSTKITIASVAPPASETTEGVTVVVSGEASPQPNADVLGEPQIVCSGAAMQCNGQAISGANASTQTVVVGQTITLTTTPTAATLAALPIPLNLAKTNPTTWTAPGTIDDYLLVPPNPTTSKVSSASVAPTVLTNPGLKAYWLYPTPNVPVTYQYCVSGQTTCPQATAKFDVTGPKASIASNPPSTSAGTACAAWWVSAPYSGCTLNDGQPTQFLTFGVLFPPPATCSWSVLIPGIAFEATEINLDGVTAPNGVFLWAQIITGGQITGAAAGKKVVPFPQSLGLDGSFPYSAATPTTTFDTPNLGLQNSLTTRETRAFTAQMYLMWKSNLDPASITVPIGFATWSITGTADQTASASPPWSLAANQVATTVTYTPSTDTGAPNHGLPVWSANVPLGPTSSNQSESVVPDGEEENKQ